MKALLLTISTLLVFSLTGCVKDETTEYSVTLYSSAGGSTVGEGKFPSGSTVTVVATADEEYSFNEWRDFFSGEVLSIDSIYSFTLSDDISILAHFEYDEVLIEEYLVTLSFSIGGTSEGGGVYESGAEVSLAATADENYVFIEWRDSISGEVLSTDTNYSFILTDDITIVAYFEELVLEFLISEDENIDIPVVPNYTTAYPFDQLNILTRYIGDLFLTEGISQEKSGVVNQDGVTQMVLNTQDLESRGLYSAIQGGGPHIWIAKRSSSDSALHPWADPTSELVFQMNASVPFVEMTDKDGNTASSMVSASLVPVTQLCFGFYLYDEIKDKTFAFIIAVYESRGPYQESANYNDTYVNFVSSPLMSSSNYITKAPESVSLQYEPFTEEKLFKVIISRENMLKVVRDASIDLSDDLSKYRLTFAGVIFELPNYVEDGHNTSMVNVSDFSVYAR